MKVAGKDIRIAGQFLRIARLEGEGYLFLEDHPEGLIDALRECGRRIDVFTFTQKVPDIRPKYDYPMEWDNCAAIQLSTFDHWWTQQIRAEARNRARQAGKHGVVTREVPFDAALVKGIWGIYNETPIRGGRRFPHYGEDLQTVYEEEATYLDRSCFIGAFLGEALIGFVKLTADDTGTQANLMNILSMIKHRDKAPTNALIAHSVRFCADHKIAYLVYQRFSYGGKRADGIAKFKEVNGFQKFDLPRYYVPLTDFGRLALRLGLHHGWKDRMPENLATRLRDLRSMWYSRRFPVAREAAR